MKAAFEPCLRCHKGRRCPGNTLFDHIICSRPRCEAFKALLETLLEAAFATSLAAGGRCSRPISCSQESSRLPNHAFELHADALLPFCAELADNSACSPARGSRAESRTTSRERPHVDRSRKPSENRVRECLDRVRKMGCPGLEGAQTWSHNT